MTYKVYDLVTKECISNVPNTSIILKPNGRIAYNDYGDEIGIPNCIVLFFPYPQNEHYWIDEVGGIHDSGCGFDPTGKDCGECSYVSCKICDVWRRSLIAIESPWEEGACDECRQRTETDECAAHASKAGRMHCRKVKNCLNYKEKYDAVGLSILDD